MNNVIITSSKLSKTYASEKIQVKALKDASFTINKGDFVSIVGASGSGKSTLLNLLGMIETPTNGELKIAGKDVSKLKDKDLTRYRANEIGFIYQSFNLIPVLTILDNIILQLELSGVRKKDRKNIALNALKKVNLEHRINNYPSELSGGEKQRASIARAIAKKPKILLADEPTGSLDSKNGAEIMELLKRINEDGTTILMVTHDLKLAEQTEKKLVMKDGVLESGR